MNRRQLFSAALVMFLSLSLLDSAAGGIPKKDVERIYKASPGKASTKPLKSRKLLVFSRMEGYRHKSTPWGAEAVRILGEKTGAYVAECSDDKSMFDRKNLFRFDAVVFNNNCNSGIVDPIRRKNLLDFVRSGRGFVGIHSAAHPKNWPEFVDLLGAYSVSHPWNAGSRVTLAVEEPDHPVVKCFGGATFAHTDEIFQFKDYTRKKLRVLVRLDTSRTDMKKPGIFRKDGDFGLVWVRKHGKGRVFYSALGHQIDTYWNPTILAHFLAGIQFALGDLTANATPKSPTVTKPIMFNTPRADAVLGALKVFPPDNPWNQRVDRWPLHPNSKTIVASVGRSKPLRYNPDMAFVIVPPNQKRIGVQITAYPGESDKGPYPVPDNVPIEGWPANYSRNPKTKKLMLLDVQRDTLKQGGDRHAIVVDPTNRMLYEFFGMRRTPTGWQAAQASIFDLKTNKLRPKGWTSADAAGLPIFPSIVRYDELKRGRIDHALRVTIRKTRRAFIAPATHFASRHTNKNYPRMGERFRLRTDFNVSKFSPEVRTILTALKRYGMFVADNGIEWAISVAPDERIPVLHEELRRVKGSDFEVVISP
ncbi:MAG: ThuA domain-containing protein [Phycisphaerae bacterium]|nr:ThuA domain-containing protein [Phycisphaerae bacterium]